MGLSLLKRMPQGTGDLVTISNLPILVEPSDAYKEAKAVLVTLVEDAGRLVNAITTDEAYNEAIGFLTQVKRFKKDIEAGIKPSKDLLNDAKNTLMEYIHDLDGPAAELERALSTETARYSRWREEEKRREDARRREEAEAERKRKQRELDMDALHLEITRANNLAAEGEVETAREIRQGLKRIEGLLAHSEISIGDPILEANAIRGLVAHALQNEQARAAAARARESGDKKTAKAIEKAAADAPAPAVQRVVQERVEAAPIVTHTEPLARAKGQHTKVQWRVKRIFDPSVVLREFLVPSEGLLNAYAKRSGEIEPRTPGVEFEKDERTIGIRS